MDYMGRISLEPIEYEGKTVELDHWANWFFHIFMETDKKSPVYGKAPRRLASAYAGMAVYSNWVFADPEEQDKDVWRRGIPTSPERVGPDAGKFCLNPKKVEFCSNISQTAFPPAADATSATSGQAAAKGLMAPHFFPLGNPAHGSILEQLKG